MRNRYVNGRNALILAFIVFHLFAVLYWNFYWVLGWDEGSNQEIYSTLRYYVQPAGLWQNWAVFAPPPSAEEHVVIEGRAGNLTVNYTPSYQGIPARFSHEKERKWHENMLKDEFSVFRMVYLEYWCRQFERIHDADFTGAAMMLYQKDVPGLGEKSEKVLRFVRKWEVDC